MMWYLIVMWIGGLTGYWVGSKLNLFNTYEAGYMDGVHDRDMDSRYAKRLMREKRE